MTDLSKILLATANAAATCRLLKEAGYEAIVAEDSAQVLTLVRAHRPDLLLIDASLPAMDSVHLCRQIKSDPELAPTFIVLLHPAGAESSGAESGADETIAYPISDSALLAYIKALLRTQNAEKGLQQTHGEMELWLIQANQTRRALLSVLEDERNAQQALQQRAAQLALLNEIGAQIAATLDLDLVLERAAHLVQEHLGYHHVAIFVLNHARSEVVMRAIAGHFVHLFPREHHLKLGQGMVGWAALHGETLVANDVDAEPRYINFFPDQVPTRSELSVPLRLGGEVVGVIDLQSPQRDAFTQNDVMVIETLADQIAVAIGNARLYQAEQEQRRLAEALAQAAAAVASSLHLDQVLDRILEEAAKVIPADAYNIMLIEDSKMRLVRWRGYEDLGLHERQLDRLIEPERYPSFVIMTQQGQPVIIADTHNDPNWVLEEGQELWRSYAGAPLRVKGITVGFLNVNSTQVGKFSPADAQRLQALADQAAIAIENAQLYQELIRHAEELERRVAERTAQLEAQYEQLEAILQSTADGILVTDTRGEIIHINTVAFEWLNHRLAAQDAHHLRDVIRDLAQHAREQPETTVELPGLDLQLKANQIGGWQTPEPFVVITGHDISEWKELDRMKSRFVSNVSHELRTPVTTIKLYIELMRRSPPEEWAEYLEVVEQEADRQARLVEDILQLSRIDAGRLELHPTAVPLNNLVTEAVANHQAMARQKELLLEQRLADSTPLAWVDASQIMQVLNNLIENAIHYTMSGKVTVSSGMQEQEGKTWATVTVSDTGIGISDEDLPRIFDRFYRGRMPRGVSVPGTGLGLAIVKEIVEMHGGKVTVESKVGAGSTFTVWLPPAAEEPP